MSKVIQGKAYVVRDNIDTDQIIPAQYLTLVPTIPEEIREALASYALCVVAEGPVPGPIHADGQAKTPYALWWQDAISAAAVPRARPDRPGRGRVRSGLAEGFARISFAIAWRRANFIPSISRTPLRNRSHRRRMVLDLDGNTLQVVATRTVFQTKPLGDARPVIDAGGNLRLCAQDGHDRRPGESFLQTEKLAAIRPRGRFSVEATGRTVVREGRASARPSCL